MSGTITKEAYQQLIEYDKEWIAKQEHCLETDHIESVLRWAPYYAYDCVDINSVRDFLLKEAGQELADKFYYSAINDALKI